MHEKRNLKITTGTGMHLFNENMISKFEVLPVLFISSGSDKTVYCIFYCELNLHLCKVICTILLEIDAI